MRLCSGLAVLSYARVCGYGGRWVTNHMSLVMSDDEMPDFVEQDPQDEEYREEQDDVEESDAEESDDEEDDVKGDVGDDESGEYEEDDDAQPKQETPASETATEVPDQPVKRRRGRPPGSGRKKPPKSGRFQPLQIPLDEQGMPYAVQDDELLLTEDPAGEEKVDKLGFMKGGRELRLRTFTILGRGQRQYMLATEPARCIGFRDSYLLFQRHRKLLKVKLADDEKFDLIDREIIPHSYKGRTLGVVTARSVFREFGARVVVGGRRVRDDYYETEAKELGHTPDEIADPEDIVPPEGQEYDKNQYCAWYNAPAPIDSTAMYENNLKNVLQKQSRPEGASQPELPDAVEPKTLFADPELVRASTQSAAGYNKLLLAGRRQVLEKSVGQTITDPHTSVRFVPSLVQPLRSRITRIAKRAPRGAVMVTTVLKPRLRATHLGDLEPSIYADADEATKRAIAKQIACERK